MFKAIFTIMFFNILISPDLYIIALPAKGHNKMSGEYLYSLHYYSVDVLYRVFISEYFPVS